MATGMVIQPATVQVSVMNGGGTSEKWIGPYGWPGVYPDWPDANSLCNAEYAKAVGKATVNWSAWANGYSGTRARSGGKGWLGHTSSPLYARIDANASRSDVQFKLGYTSRPANSSLFGVFFILTTLRDGVAYKSEWIGTGLGAYSPPDYGGEAYFLGDVDNIPLNPVMKQSIVNIVSSEWTFTISDAYVEWSMNDTPFEEEVSDVTDTAATLKAFNYCQEAWFEYNTKAAGFNNPLSTAHSYKYGPVTFNLTGLLPDTWYWYRFVMMCDGKRTEGEIYYFKTNNTDDFEASIITLPATEVWATGATVHGELNYQGDNKAYLHLGFQWGLKSAELANEPIRWCYSGNYSKGRHPIQFTINGLYPDRTYYFRACLHVGDPPFTANNYFGSMLSFGGPVSVFGTGREFVTAKKISDDVASLGIGRYYVTRDGILQYESAKHREA